MKLLQFDKAENYSECENKELTLKCKFYGAQINERILIPEHVFRGFLVSTLKCEDCDHTSPCHESFLDISLPVNINRSRMSSVSSASTSANARYKNNSQSPSPPRQTNSKKDRKKAREEKKLERKAFKKQQKMMKDSTVNVDESRQHTAEYFMKTQQQTRTQSSSSDASDSESKDLSNMSTSGYDSNGNKEVNPMDHKRSKFMFNFFSK